ncbi:MAG: class I SAM-dependent methyltransferase [Candidatus Eisenbacteria bacterium]|nr:class I SAM-dependent methyltransferase [Candidatus Eisenbacteria bacterium]
MPQEPLPMPLESISAAPVVLAPWSDNYAKWYDMVHYDHPYSVIANKINDLARRRWGTNKRVVVEVGCGTGTLTYFLRHRLPADWVLMGCDPSKGMLDMAHNKYPSMRWEHGTFPFEGNADLIVASFNVVNYVEDLGAWMTDAVGALTNDGMLLFDALDAEDVLRNGMKRLSKCGTQGRYRFSCDMAPERDGEKAKLNYHVTITKDRKPHLEFKTTHKIVLWTMRRLFDCMPAKTYVRVEDWGPTRFYVVTRRP